jgi:hypothetical protein
MAFVARLACGISRAEISVDVVKVDGQPISRNPMRRCDAERRCSVQQKA